MAKSKGEEVKVIVLEWVKLVNQVEKGHTKYYMPKAIDIFLSLPEAYQYGILKYFAEKVGNDEWLERIGDNTQYMDVLRSIMFYYTGKAEVGQPSRMDFNIGLGEYLRSSYFKKPLESGYIEDFKQDLESL